MYKLENRGHGVDLQVIQSKIYEIRGQRVMLDRDLAMLYDVETRVLNQAVKRHIGRFPEDFMFQMTEAEWKNMTSQFVMTSWGKRPKSALPLAFTEYGVVMLASVLRSDIAVQTSILITRAFVAMRQLVARPPDSKVEILQKDIKDLREYIEDVFADQNDINEDTRMQIELINQALAELQVKNKGEVRKERPRIGFIKPEE